MIQYLYINKSLYTYSTNRVSQFLSSIPSHPASSSSTIKVNKPSWLLDYPARYKSMVSSVRWLSPMGIVVLIILILCC